MNGEDFPTRQRNRNAENVDLQNTKLIARVKKYCERAVERKTDTGHKP